MSPAIPILYEDSSILAVNKPPRLSVHGAPGPGRSLLRELRSVPRASRPQESLIPVHRLDKDASGVLLFAKSEKVAAELQKTWNQVEKTYWALCAGVPPEKEGEIAAPIIENQTGKPERLANQLKWYRKENPGLALPPLPQPKTSAVHPAGRPSQTRYRVVETFDTPGGKFSILEVTPRQGRMHQIRVHLAHIGVPLAVDPLYGTQSKLISGESVLLSRLSLHALRLKLPRERELTIEAPLAEDLAAVARVLHHKLNSLPS